MSTLQQFIEWLRTPRALRHAMNKRRLQRIAQEAGAPRAMAMKIASLYFKNDLEEHS